MIIRHRGRYNFVQVGQSLFPTLDANAQRHPLGNGKETIPGYYACFKKNMWRPMLQFKEMILFIKKFKIIISKM